MKDLGESHGQMHLFGLPAESEWGPATSAQLHLLSSIWTLSLGSDIGDRWRAPPRPHSILERVYRAIDRRIFGRSLGWTANKDWLALTPKADCENCPLQLACSDAAARQPCDIPRHTRLCVEYEGLPMCELEEAVRQRLGHSGATLNARVWLIDAGTPRKLLFQGQLDLDHRSLCKSVALCAAKLPALLRGALARIDHPSVEASTLPERSGKALPAYQQILRLAGAVAERLLWREQWQIETGLATESAALPHRRQALIRPPRTAFWADPFLLHLEERLWLLFEELPFLSGKGHICAIELDRSGKPMSGPKIALQEPWHLAYPFVYTCENQIFMIPDASKSRTLNLYECHGDPLNWTLRATLMSGHRLADSTIATFEGRHWMFATHGDERASMDDTLHIYWADRLEGPWHAHELNPVKIDARTARPAGSMWVADGVLHRVVQDCSTVYGGAIHCMRVLRLNEHEFEEEVDPTWDDANARQPEPWHTFNRHADVTVVDRLRRQPRWRSQRC